MSDELTKASAEDAEVPEVDDSEILIKHVPPGPMWMSKEQPPVITSANFDLQDDESGCSVSRLKLTEPIVMLSNLKCRQDSRVAHATAGAIRNLGFEVLKDPVEHDRGHAEIRSNLLQLSSHGARKKLSKKFDWYPNNSNPLLVVETDDSKVTKWLDV